MLSYSLVRFLILKMNFCISSKYFFNSGFEQVVLRFICFCCTNTIHKKYIIWLDFSGFFTKYFLFLYFGKAMTMNYE